VETRPHVSGCALFGHDSQKISFRPFSSQRTSRFAFSETSKKAIALYKFLFWRH
jgi:hypothetical protein